MRVIYADPGLIDNVGHYGTSCRSITGELRRRDLLQTVLAHKDVDQMLRSEVGAVPFFNRPTNWFSDGDPIAGQLNAFDISAEDTYRDLQRLSVDAADIVYFNSVRPPQFYAALLWLGLMPPERRPHVILEFGNEPGLVRAPDGKLVIRDPRHDPTAMLYRFASCRAPAGAEDRLHLVTFEDGISRTYSALLKRPVTTLPPPIHATKPLRKRGDRMPLTVAVMGVQRWNKGYHLIPDVAHALVQSRPEIRFLAHNSAPAQMPEPQQRLRELASTDPRIVADERVLGVWQDLLDASDLILCPYHPETFYLSHSNVTFEAIANAIPVVGPAGTTVERLIRTCGRGCGTVFEKFEVESITAAVLAAIDGFQKFADLAFQAAQQWPQRFGPQRLVDRMLALVNDPRPKPPETATDQM